MTYDRVQDLDTLQSAGLFLGNNLQWQMEVSKLILTFDYFGYFSYSTLWPLISLPTTPFIKLFSHSAYDTM